MAHHIKSLGMPHPDRSFTLALALEPSAAPAAIAAYTQWRSDPRAFWPVTGHAFADCILDQYELIADPQIPFSLGFNGYAWGSETTTSILVQYLIFSVFPFDRALEATPYALLWPEPLPPNPHDRLIFLRQCTKAIHTQSIPADAHVFSRRMAFTPT